MSEIVSSIEAGILPGAVIPKPLTDAPQPPRYGRMAT